MALSTPALLTADPDTSNVASFVTPSHSPTTGAQLICGVYNTDGSNAVLPSLASNYSVVGGSWTQLCTIQAAAGTRRLTLFGAVHASGTGGVTASFGGDNQTGAIVTVVEITGQSATGSLAQTATDEGGGAGATSLSISLPGALAATANMVVAFIGHNTNEDQTAGSGGTEVTSSDVGYSSPAARMGCYYEVNDNTVSASWATSSAKLAAAVEVVAAADGGGGGTVKVQRLTLLGVG